ncbi:MAG: cytochrome c biogenesis protein CcdA [Pseudomonadota bacterium]
MIEAGAFTLFVLPVGLGLLGFVEPCSIGSTLVFIKYLEGRDATAKLAQVGIFTAARALFTGALGLAAVALGAAFIGFQKAGWVLLGTLYATIGALFIAGRANVLMVALGPALARLSPAKGSVVLGVLFGLNLPACAAPLILALLAAAAAGGAAGAAFAAGFTSLALFGLAISAPLVAAVFFEPVRRMLDRLAGLSRRIPFWTGVLLLLLGAWSIRFAFVADIGP